MGSDIKRKTKNYKTRDITRFKQTERTLRGAVATFHTVGLLSLAWKVMDFEKIQKLIAAKADCKSSINNRLLLKIAQNRTKKFGKHHNRKIHYLTMTQLLLEHGADPDYCDVPNSPTSLMIAAYHNDQTYAFLLLRYNANPDHSTQLKHIKQLEYPFWYHKKKPVTINAYNVETGEPKGWLIEMVNNINKTKSIYI